VGHVPPQRTTAAHAHTAIDHTFRACPHGRDVAIPLHDHVIEGNTRPHVTSHLALWSPTTQITPSGQPAITPRASCVTASVPSLMIVMTTRDDFITAEMKKSGKNSPNHQNSRIC